jgi:hypothetical protein
MKGKPRTAHTDPGQRVVEPGTAARVIPVPVFVGTRPPPVNIEAWRAAIDACVRRARNRDRAGSAGVDGTEPPGKTAGIYSVGLETFAIFPGKKTTRLRQTERVVV